MSNRKKKPATTAEKQNSDVEELLRAAEEDVFLKLNLNSHTLRGSSSQFIDPDIDRRFQSLKSNKTPQKSQTPPINQNHSNQSKTLPISSDDDDLLGRFEALKKTLPSYQQNSNTASLIACGGEEEEDEEEDEVEKVIKWAMDAARLDPSPDTEDEVEEDEETEDNYDSEDDYAKKSKKGNISKKK